MTTQEIIKRTKELMRIPSTADNPQALNQAVDYVAALVATCPGVTIERFERNGKPSFLAYRGPKRPKKFDILLNGHVDVVPGTPEQFEPFTKDGRLCGRGALDMKGTAMALTDAFCTAVNDVPYTLGLQIVSDEEIGGYNGVRLQIEADVRAEFVIMGEYANHPHTIYNAARGICWAEIIFKGKTAHGGHLWHGSNALIKASDFATAVLKQYPTPDKETWTTTASIASLSTPNDTFNKVPDAAVLKIDFRFTQEDPTFASEDAVRAFIASIDPEAELVNLATFEPAVNVEKLNPYVQGLSRALEHASGKKTRFLGRPAGSDGRHYALVHNDIVEFGLYGQGSHSDNEYVELDSFAEYQATLREFLQEPRVEAKRIRPKKLLGEPLHEAILRKLVSMPTLSDDTAMNLLALDYVQQFLAERGMHCNRSIFDGHGVLLASTRIGNAMQPTVLLAGHMDVARAAEEQFRLREKDGKLYGRGVYDMKGAIASYMALVDELQENLSDYDFAILISTDEEPGGQNGSNGTQSIVDLGCAPQICILPDAAAAGWNIEKRIKGPWRFELIAEGRTAHGSRPWEGDSATSKLVTGLHELEGLFAGQNHHTDTINVGIIHGGTEFNEVAANASASVEIRLLNHASIAKNRAHIDRICQKYGLRYVEKTLVEPATHDLTGPLTRTFIQSITAVTGHVPEEVTSLGASDAKYFMQLGIPCVLSCPAGGGHHGGDEWVDRASLAQLGPILKHYLDRTALDAAQTDKTLDAGAHVV